MQTDSTTGASKGIALRIVMVLLVMLAAFALRIVTTAASELAAGDAAEARGDRVEALTHFRRAGRSYVPLSSYHVRALSRLQRLAEQAERDGDADLALSTYRAIRSAILSARSLYTPERRTLELANQHIATLMARQPPPPIDVGKSEAQLRAEHLALLSTPAGPHQGFALLALAGLVTWIGGAYLLFQRGMSDEGHLVAKRASRYGVAIVMGLIGFCVGLWKA